MKTHSALLGLVFTLMVIVLATTCKKKENSNTSNPPVANTNIPTLTTLTISMITDSSAVSGGSITSAGDGNILSAGLCWDTVPNPTISSNKTNNYQNNMSFIGTMDSLLSDITYYVRAYATNLHGTAYGNELSFSTNKRWINISKAYPGVSRFLASTGTNLFLATYSHGVFRSSDNGKSWTAINNGLNTIYIFGLTVNGNRIFLNSYEKNLFYLDDQSTSSMQCDLGTSSSKISEVKATGGKILATNTNNELLLSEDNGISWKHIYFLVPPGYFSNFLARDNEILVFLHGAIQRRIVVSPDKGASWTNRDFGTENYSASFNSVIPIGNDLLVATSLGAELLQPNATSFIVKNNGLDPNSPGLSNMVLHKGTLYASGRANVYFSNDNASSWTVLSHGLPDLPSQVITDLIIHGNYLYVITQNSVTHRLLYRYRL